MRAKVLGFLASSLLSLPLAASANVITLYGDWTSPPPGAQITYTADDDRASVECVSFICQALISSLPSGIYDPNVPNVSTQDGFSSLSGDLFWLADNSDATELGFVNAVVDPDFASGSKTNVNLESFEFGSSALYILLKIGADPNVALIYNPTGQHQMYRFSGFAGEGAGLSHITEFGTTTRVPEPGTLALLGLGLAGIAALRRRKQ